ncbi:acetyl-CoA synthetase-like protein [Marasmius fiardii PR-910]|nr:acetyl-CoA synthetase-like protein [Marasmius fiardii PR-910]
MLTTPLHLLANAASETPDAPAFKIPIIDCETDQIAEWKSITYSKFALDVSRLAEQWLRVFLKDGILPGSVIAICLGGFEYPDVVHVYSIQRAGYIPHVFSRQPGIEIVKDLLKESDTRALIRASQFKEVLQSIQDIPVYDAETMDPNGASLIIHTSGSTSGRPKLVRVTHRWMNAVIQKARIPFPPGYPPASGAAIVTWMGNICHLAQHMMMAHQLLYGKCTVQPRKSGDIDDIIDQIRTGLITRIEMFTPLAVKLLQKARSDPVTLALLSSLESLVIAGAIFPKSEEAFAIQNNINVVDVFGSTEGGFNLITRGTRSDPTGTFRVIDVPGISYQFDPISVSPEAGGQPKLFELVVRSDSMDCPPHKFRRPDDGHFHTGDLWEAVEGGYLYRGRDDDWIKTGSAVRCDARAIEDNVRLTCGDLISECVVVGYGRPSPALFVEPNPRAWDIPEADLKRLILKRIDPINSQLMVHEKIASADLIVVVPLNTLPRTQVKGNIRRKAVEGMFEKELDLAYGGLV